MKAIFALVTVGHAMVATNEDDAKSCCTPMDNFKLITPTRDWICGDLREAYNHAWEKCGHSTDGFFD